MKKIIVLCILALLTAVSFAPTMSSMQATNLQTETPINIDVSQVGETITINYEINEYALEEIQIDGTLYNKVTVDSESNFLELGYPDVPNICRSVVIPDTKKMAATIIDTQYVDLDNIKIAPSKGNLLRTVDPDEVAYTFSSFYTTDSWYPEELVSLREPYIIRDFRGQVIELNPFQYNPTQQTLRIYTEVTIEVKPIGLDTRNIIQRDTLPDTIASSFYSIYHNQFINSKYLFTHRYTPVEEFGNMLIITYDSFEDEMIPFYEWKIEKGVPTEMVKVSTIGDANAIKNYIQQYYQNDALTYVLLVGDAQQVPSYTAGYSASDPTYTYVAGSDHYPDLFVGRFSAQNEADLLTQIERSIEYEKYPQAGADWYHKGIGVASNQGPGDDGEYDDEHIDNIRTKLLGFTYSEIEQSYDPSGTSTKIANAVNAGLSIANYCGHGSPTSWGNGGGFSVSNVNSLVNDNMLPFIVSVACNNGQFDDYEPCYAEAWLRATNNGEPTGGIGMYASTISQSWNPPMDAQDEIVDLLIRTYSDNYKTTYGALCYNGAMHMNDEYGSSGFSETDYWTVFGDPSLQVRTDTPSTMNVQHDPLVQIGATTYELDITDTEDAICAVSQDGILYGYGYSDSSGHATVNFFEPMEFMPEATLTVTAFNKVPYTATLQVGSSYPPEIPEFDGPSGGCRNKEYTFSAQTTDPENDDIYYLFDWGDGTDSDWIGPVSSGEGVTASHAWSSNGNYSITVRAKDTEGAMSRWSDPYQMRIGVPELDVAPIKGSLIKITGAVRNHGIAEADNVEWTLTLDGGFILVGQQQSGTIDTIPAGGKVDIETGPIFGFGKTRVILTAEHSESSDVRTQGATVLFFIISVLPGGG